MTTSPAPTTSAAPATDARPGLTPKRLYRLLAFAEVVTWTILITAMILKYAAGIEWAVLVGGSIHGFVFLAYAFQSVLVGVNQRWNVGRIAFAVLTAIVPYATVPFDLWLVRKGHLEGEETPATRCSPG